MSTPTADFAYETAFTLAGTLHTTMLEPIRTILQTHIRIDTNTDERYADYVLTTDTIRVQVRHDDPEFSSNDLVSALLDADPNLRGTLTMEWPYSEIQERSFPVDLVFQGQHRAHLIPYHLVPADPIWQWTADGSQPVERPPSTPPDSAS